MKTPEVSIIVPVYNSERYLKRCIESIIMQDFDDWELILVNDGSLDSSSKICDFYTLKDSRIKVIHKKNEGVSSARNIGIENASGKWITFIDSDDWIDNGYFQIFKKNITSDLIMLGYKVVNESLNIVFSWNPKSSDSALIKDLKNYNTTCWGYFFINEKIQTNNLKFPLNIRYGEDQVFLMKYLLLSESFLIESTSFYNYFQHVDSVMAQPYTEKRAEDHLKAIIELLIFQNEHYKCIGSLKVLDKMIDSFIKGYWYIILHCVKKLAGVSRAIVIYNDFRRTAENISNKKYSLSYFNKLIIYIYYIYVCLKRK